MGKDQFLVGSRKAGDQGSGRVLSCEGRKGRQLWCQLISLIP